MKIKHVKLIVLVFFMSCTDSNDIIESSGIQGRCIQEIPDCDNGGNPEINCTEYLDFIDRSTVDFLIGGGDIIYRTSYEQNEDAIELEPINFPISFLVQNDSTLIRVEDNEVWHKEE